VPDVPVTVRVKVVDCALDAGDGVPPHPVSATMERVEAIKIGSKILRCRMQKQPNTAAIAASGTKGELPGREFRLAFAEAAIVSVDMLFAGTLAGANEQVTPAGRPEHESETDCANPFKPLMFTAVRPELPADTTIDGGVSDMAKSGGGRLIAYAAEATLLGE